MLLRFVVLVLFIASSSAMANDFSGLWLLKAGGTTIFRLNIRHNTKWSGEWARPRHFELDGDGFKNVAGPVVRRRSVNSQVSNGWLILTFTDPEFGSIPDVFRVRRSSYNKLDVDYNGVRMGRLVFIAETRSGDIGHWSRKRTYTYLRDTEYPTSSAMTAIFDSDQRARNGADSISTTDLDRDDRDRLQRTQALLASDSLHSGSDFYHAAVILQHGNTPDDFLRAHTLAVISIARGNGAAVWLAAATLDRFLQSIGHSQISGTQFNISNEGTTQEPFARSTLSDLLREGLHVPGIEQQEAQRKLIDGRGRPNEPRTSNGPK